MTKHLTLAVILLLCTLQSAKAQLRVVTELSPPNQMLENNQVTGTSTEVVKQILKYAQLDAQFLMYPWARAYQQAQKHPNILIYSMVRTAEREKLFHWIGPVALFKLGFVTTKERPDIKITHLSHAIPYRLALQRGDISEDILKSRGFDYILTADIVKSYQLLIAKKVDIILDDARYLTPLANSFGLADDSFRFVYEVPELTLNGYLAASLATPHEVVEELRKGHEKVKKSAAYKNVMAH
ncbi:amino acid ABC transporter substrate-binding protein [Pseudoalteromonas sp. MSK9-3]|uniref:substrate-binding periplasmic protein n=1 Tax=Pseudoalteromonas sp. MSK9-3 TaxID=1897633 RepID=UPI000E6D1884|nr:transporter substrate-binding domain-containing protein [Pseudoalteromonas sp. MSK9-3]RJE73396.1 amino acid ABC transporter substrate-binding protein [Pseudoalteromonas sp. MSK9-3]